MDSKEKREVLRHMAATVGFRGRIAIADAPEGFADLRVTESSRTPAEILAHIGDLLIGSCHLMRGEFVALDSRPLPWDEETERFTGALRQLDDLLASDAPLAYPIEKFVQGPVGDALTHVGQLVLLRRISGSPVRQVPYFTADIA